MDMFAMHLTILDGDMLVSLTNRSVPLQSCTHSVNCLKPRTQMADCPTFDRLHTWCFHAVPICSPILRSADARITQI
jgi:hypothetical protein